MNSNKDQLIRADEEENRFLEQIEEHMKKQLEGEAVSRRMSSYKDKLIRADEEVNRFSEQIEEQMKKQLEGEAVREEG